MSIRHKDFLERYQTIVATILDRYPDAKLLEQRRVKIFLNNRQLSVQFFENQFVMKRGTTSGCQIWDEDEAEWAWAIWFPVGSSFQELDALRNQVTIAIKSWEKLICGVTR